MPENYLKNVQKTIRFFVFHFNSNKFINFSESILIFSIFFYFRKKIEFKKNERNVTNFGYVFVIIFHITFKNFSGKGGSSTITPSIFLKSSILKNVTRNLKNSYGF